MDGVTKSELPPVALSVRQPWAWAIVAGHKDVENRTPFSVEAGNMDRRRIAIHAASLMSRREYEWAVWRMRRHGVEVPRPFRLVRGAVVGAADVTAIVTEHDSEWFASKPGMCGLVLSNVASCAPVPAAGERGYFQWQPGGRLAEPKPWMREWAPPMDDLFGLEPECPF